MVKDHSDELVVAGLSPCVCGHKTQMEVIRGDSGDLSSTKMWRERWKDKQKCGKGD